MKLLEFMTKAIKPLLIELVGQCMNILPLAFSGRGRGRGRGRGGEGEGEGEGRGRGGG